MYLKVKYKLPIKIATIITEIINIVANAIKLLIKISNYYSSFISIFAPQWGQYLKFKIGKSHESASTALSSLRQQLEHLYVLPVNTQ